MRILADDRPTLRQRTGVGAYMHQLIGAYAARYPGEVTLCTSSWRDRPPTGLASALGVEVVDRGATGLERARAVTWTAAATTLRAAYLEAVARREQS